MPVVLNPLQQHHEMDKLQGGKSANYSAIATCNDTGPIVAEVEPGVVTAASSKVDKATATPTAPATAKGGDQPPISLYFGGCCWGAAFYVGAYRAMYERWGADFRHKTLITGDSAGSIFAVGVALGRTPDEMDEMYQTMSEISLTHGVIGKCATFMENYLRELLLDHPNAYLELQGRCRFGTTVFPFTHQWHEKWESNEQLLAEMRCSFHVPVYCSRVPPLRQGGYVVDGAYGIAGHDLPHGDQTLFIGIDPHAEVTRLFTFMQMFYPALGKPYDDIAQSGYDAMMAWDGEYLVKVGSRTANYSALYVLWALKFVEIIIDILEFLLISIPMRIAGVFFPQWYERMERVRTAKAVNPAPFQYQCHRESVKGFSAGGADSGVDNELIAFAKAPVLLKKETAGEISSGSHTRIVTIGVVTGATVLSEAVTPMH